MYKSGPKKGLSVEAIARDVNFFHFEVFVNWLHFRSYRTIYGSLFTKGNIKNIRAQGGGHASKLK
jgi:hypothetical protein